MKNKYDILMYVAAIFGGILGAYLCAKKNDLGVVVAIICSMYIMGHTVMYGTRQWQNGSEKRLQRKKN